MPYRLRTFTCRGCGRPVDRRAPARAEVRCILCAVARAVENAQQLRYRAGPHYERWAAGMARAAAEAQQLAAIGADIDRIEDPWTGTDTPTPPQPPG